MKSSLMRVEKEQLQESLFRDINLVNAITQGCDPLTDPLCKIPSWASIDFFVTCLDKREAEFVPAFRYVIDAYYDGVALSAPVTPALDRIFTVIANYRENS